MVHKKQLSYTKRLAANKIIDLLYQNKISAARALVKKNYKRNTELYYFFIGWISQLENKHDLSIQMFEKALILNPLNEDVLIGLAGSYLELNDFERAEECASHAVTINNKNPKNLLTLATVISKSNVISKTVQSQAEILFEQALDLCTLTDSNSQKLLVDILAGWGGCLLNLGEIDQAKAVLEQATKYDSYNPIAHKNLVSVYANLNDLDNAIASCKIAEMSEDKNIVIDTLYQEGMLELLRGNYAKGWRLHEARLESSKYKYRELLNKGSLTLTQLTEHNSILLFQEQGIGDLLQFAHLIPQVYKQCKTIDLVVLPNTFLPMIEGKVPSPKQFIEHNFGKYIRRVYVKDVDAITEHYDCVTSIMSLGYWLKTTPKNFTTLPFTSSIHNTAYTNKIGLLWKGSKHHANDSLRSAPTSCINDLIHEHSDLSFVSLQLDRDPELKQHSNLISAEKDLEGLLNVAAVIENCALVVSVDSMIAHLAAGMNKPTLLLHAWSPDWRWGLYGQTNRWYPSVTDIRQSSRNNWDSVFSEVNKRLNFFKMRVD
jgi:tetratricopeptide (TPR) repeat protein